MQDRTGRDFYPYPFLDVVRPRAIRGCVVNVVLVAVLFFVPRAGCAGGRQTPARRARAAELAGIRRNRSGCRDVYCCMTSRRALRTTPTHAALSLVVRPRRRCRPAARVGSPIRPTPPPPPTTQEIVAIVGRPLRRRNGRLRLARSRRGHSRLTDRQALRLAPAVRAGAGRTLAYARRDGACVGDRFPRSRPSPGGARRARSTFASGRCAPPRRRPTMRSGASISPGATSVTACCPVACIDRSAFLVHARPSSLRLAGRVPAATACSTRATPRGWPTQQATGATDPRVRRHAGGHRPRRGRPRGTVGRRAVLVPRRGRGNRRRTPCVAAAAELPVADDRLRQADGRRPRGRSPTTASSTPTPTAPATPRCSRPPSPSSAATAATGPPDTPRLPFVSRPHRLTPRWSRDTCACERPRRLTLGRNRLGGGDDT